MDRDKTITIKLTDNLRLFWGKKVMATYGLKNSICLYTPESYREIESKLEESLNKHDLDQPGFKQFFRAGLVEIQVSPEGDLLISDFVYEYLGKSGDLYFEEKTGYIEIRRGYPM